MPIQNSTPEERWVLQLQPYVQINLAHHQLVTKIMHQCYLIAKNQQTPKPTSNDNQQLIFQLQTIFNTYQSGILAQHQPEYQNDGTRWIDQISQQWYQLRIMNHTIDAWEAFDHYFQQKKSHPQEIIPDTMWNRYLSQYSHFLIRCLNIEQAVNDKYFAYNSTKTKRHNQIAEIMHPNLADYMRTRALYNEYHNKLHHQLHHPLAKTQDIKITLDVVNDEFQTVLSYYAKFVLTSKLSTYRQLTNRYLTQLINAQTNWANQTKHPYQALITMMKKTHYHIPTDWMIILNELGDKIRKQC